MDKLLYLLKEGKTFDEVGKELGFSKQRAYQIYKQKYARHVPKSEIGAAKRASIQREKDFQAKEKRDSEILKKHNRATYQCNNDLERAQAFAFVRKKENVKRSKRKHSWDILPSDIEWPTHCPILGIELDWFATIRQENSPSFDRIDPSKGYIKGNVRIVSWRANRIKNDGTLEEHKKIVEYLEKNNA